MICGTPLAAILGSATTLISGDGLYDEAQTKELLHTIREEAERLDRFVGNLLDMSRLEAGALGAKPEPLDVIDIVEGATQRLSRRLLRHSVLRSIPHDLPLVMADGLLVEQALVNALDNAAKYAPPGSTITLRARTFGGKVELTVADEGPGIPAEALPHIFDKFYRAKASDRRVAGTGLGLAVAKGFVEAFGGTFQAANRPTDLSGRNGAIMTITLPIAPALGTTDDK